MKKHISSRIPQRDFIPYRKVDQNLIEKLFTISQDGNYNEIKNFISNHNITFNVTNKNGETVIHSIIKNIHPSFEENQKYDVVKYFIDHGVSISNYDSNNVTPLHLAAKYQLVSIVKLLLENGADPTATDNQSMTPLHYAAQGYIVECKKDRRVGSLIPKKSIEKRPTDDFQDITINIIDIMYTKQFRKYTTHIRRSVDKIDEIYPEKFASFKDEFVNSATELLSENSTSDREKVINLRNRTTEMINEINDFLSEKLNRAINSLDIKPGQEEGWGPTIHPEEMILPYHNINEMIDDVTQDYNITKAKYFKKLDENSEKLLELANQLNAYKNEMFNDIHAILLHNYNVYINGPQADAGSANPAIDWKTLHTVLIHTDTDSFDLWELDALNDDGTNMTSRDIQTPAFFAPEITAGITAVRGTKEQREQWKKSRMRSYAYPLTFDLTKTLVGPSFKNDDDLNHLNDPNNALSSFQIDATNNFGINVPGYPGSIFRYNNPNTQTGVQSYSINTEQLNRVYATTGFYIEKPFYFISKFVYALDKIIKHIELLVKSIQNSLKSHINNEYYYEVYHRILSYSVTTILNIFQNMFFVIIQEQGELMDKIQQLINLFNDNFVKFKNNPYSYSLEYAKDHALALQKKKNGIGEKFVSIYETLIEVHNDFNGIVELLNKKSAMQLVSNYFLKGDDVIAFGDNFAEKLDKLFDRKFRLLEKLPENIDDYINAVAAYIYDKTKQRNFLIKKYIPRIDINNYNTYYTVKQLGDRIQLFAPTIETNNKSGRGALTNQLYVIKPNDFNFYGESVSTTPIFYDHHSEQRFDMEKLKQLNMVKIPPRAGYFYFNPHYNENLYLKSDYHSSHDNTGTMYPGMFKNRQVTIVGISKDGKKFTSSQQENISTDKLLPPYTKEKAYHYMGQIGFYPGSERQDKRIAIFPSIGEYFDDHLNILKYFIIQHIILVHRDPNDKGMPISHTPILGWDKSTTVKNNIDAIKSKMMDTLKNKFNIESINHHKINGILYTTVGKITDQLLINFIKHALQSSVLKYVKSILHGLNKNIEYSKVLYNALHPSKELLQNDQIYHHNIFNIDTGFELNFNKLFDEITDAFLKIRSPKMDSLYNSLKYSVQLMEKDKLQEDQYHIYNPNYSITSEIVEQCFKIKPEIIDLLYKYHANFNEMDAVLSTPIYYAIETLHPELISKLVHPDSNKNVKGCYVTNIKNLSRQTPLEYAIKLYDHHNKLICDDVTTIYSIVQKLYKPIFKEIQQNIYSKSEYKNNIIKYLENVFPQVLFMVNHMFYMYASSYINGWNYDKMNKLSYILKDYNIIDTLFKKQAPLVELTIEALDNGSNVDALQGKKESHQKSINKINEQLQDLNTRHTSLNQELTDMNGKTNRNDMENGYRQYLQEEINNIQTEITSKKRELEVMERGHKALEYNINSRNKYVRNHNLKPNVTNFLTKKMFSIRSSAEFYNNVCEYVIKTEYPGSALYHELGHSNYLLYNKGWDLYIKHKKAVNPTNIHLLVLLLQKKMINMLQNTNKSTIDTVNVNVNVNVNANVNVKVQKEMNVLKDLYKNIFVFIIDNYNKLPEEYNVKSNYVLKEVIDIIEHIVKYNLCTNFYYAIIRTLTKFLMSINPKEIHGKMMAMHPHSGNYREYIVQMVNRIMHDDYDGPIDETKPSLQSYMVDIMPIKLVKHVLNIFEDDFDKDKEIESIDILFNNISNILQLNSVFPIKNNSSLVNNLRDYIFPYYKDVFKQVIPALKKLIDNYFRFMLNENKFISMMDTILSGAMEEL